MRVFICFLVFMILCCFWFSSERVDTPFSNRLLRKSSFSNWRGTKNVYCLSSFNKLVKIGVKKKKRGTRIIVQKQKAVFKLLVREHQLHNTLAECMILWYSIQKDYKCSDEAVINNLQNNRFCRFSLLKTTCIYTFWQLV